jgi:hypothetical protein
VQPRRDMLTREASRDACGFRPFTADEIYPDDPYWEDFKRLDCWAQTPKFWKYTCTYALSMRKSLFLHAGWFSPEFFSYGFEDVDLGYRLAKLGARFHLSQNAVYHLFPDRAELNYHFDADARYRALTLSSRVFYRHRLDPEIFAEFYPAYHQGLADASRHGLGQMRGWIGLLPPAFARVRFWFWVHVMLHLLKPYYFARYQYQKRLLPLAPREEAAEVSHVE